MSKKNKIEEEVKGLSNEEAQRMIEKAQKAREILNELKREEKERKLAKEGVLKTKSKPTKR